MKWTVLLELEVELDCDDPTEQREKWVERVERQTGIRPRSRTIETAAYRLTPAGGTPTRAFQAVRQPQQWAGQTGRRNG